ncbi:Predicted dienelactone hydrolase [Listeria ivanovii subsp. londoniensis]|uniref:Alpha/beta hydrolase n=2 Tax=Listeria ivanovii TaxID=1638 RepID=A0ABS1G3X9_LISIV|nr:alpha/beta hydrolase [Listeria ivanovii]AIS59197.1 hypothetical protein JL58_04020 [Listeria ivanovii subsp. londoniensis]MBK1961589.1 alpha/beta hydrolase [Listeria ivanovii subsp. londoniensis]MBK2002340.1 alpha/beta hydrolase [Listeria ivanovii subsp. londoniensis]SDW41000.1 hypothetical protein SAMN05421782_103109 [Listeria ivanovii]VEH45196.1 Predicted dienelactone hydrolase [Listeria ivanovii subsp. londoniensis]
MKSKKFIVLLCFLISIVAIAIVIINLTGEIKVLPTTKQQYELKSDNPVETVEYNLGKGALTTPGKTDIPYQKQGVLTFATNKKNAPLAVIIHGRHGVSDIKNIKEEENYYKGFTYLAQNLSKEGYAVISIDVNAEHHEQINDENYGESQKFERLITIYKEHINGLKKAVNGDSTVFNMDLTDKINLSDVTLIGHSRGGQGIDFLATDLKNSGDDSIKGMISLTPSKNLKDAPYTDVPHGFIIAEYDYDVDNLEGQVSFDEIKTSKNRTSFANNVFLRGANHYYFSRKLDLSFTPNVPSDNVLEKNTIDRNQHETFLTGYVTEFIDIIHNKTKPVNNFNASDVAPKTMYGAKVMSSMYVPNTKTIFSADDKTKITSSNAKAEYLVESINLKDNTIGYFRHPIDSEFNTNGPNLNLLNFKWSKKDGSATISVKSTNFTDFSTVRFSIAQDSTDKINQGKDQAMTVVFKDKDGKTAKVVVGNSTPALSYLYGTEIEYIENQTEWLGYTPLTDLRIPLDLVKGIDKENIECISLDFDQTEQGSIMLGDVVLE